MENIVLAETKDHADWELLGKIPRQSSDDRIRDILKSAKALDASMPKSGLNIDEPDYCISAAEVPKLILRLSRAN